MPIQTTPSRVTPIETVIPSRCLRSAPKAKSSGKEAAKTISTLKAVPKWAATTSAATAT